MLLFVKHRLTHLLLVGASSLSDVLASQPDAAATFPPAPSTGADESESAETKSSPSSERRNRAVQAGSPAEEKHAFQTILRPAVFDDGFTLRSEEELYQLRIRTLTQIDAKVCLPGERELAPRTRFQLFES